MLNKQNWIYVIIFMVCDCLETNTKNFILKKKHNLTNCSIIKKLKIKFNFRFQ